ncbi:MAG TPA: NAD-dependent epimerase/dehydratase family protein [Flavilitoribacter sp.]|nr:NAD-dependent epimerase/dehydratase family protein [Flavilitoribacter sp.]
MKTILVTGGTGYIGSWVVRYLLEEGHTVRVAVRDKTAAAKIQHLEIIARSAPGTLEFWEADLLKPGSFQDAMQGCGEVYHMASPFLFNRFKDPFRELINPAVEGTRNVLESVNRTVSVKRVILTSSVVAIYGDSADMTRQGLTEFTEEHWNISSHPRHQAYSYSKLLAEKEAMRLFEGQNWWKLSVINPGFVMGPMLGKNSDSESLEFMKNMLTGKNKTGVPHIVYGFTDVRDVARAHLLAAEKGADGRHIVVKECKSLLEVAGILRKLFGNKYPLPARRLPKWLMYLVGWTAGLSWKFIYNNVGYPLKFNNRRSIEQLGLQYTDLETTFADMVARMEEGGVVS